MFSKLKIQPKTPEFIEKRRLFWRKTRRRTGWTLAGLFVLHSALNIYASLQLNRELSAIRHKSQPVQFAELAPPDVPDAQNAALIYAQASRMLHLAREQKIALATRERNWTPQLSRDVEAALLANRKTLDLTRRAALMPKCRFPLDYATDNPTALLFPYYTQTRELARLLALQARLEAAKGDTNSALRDVGAVYRIADHLSGEPVFIGFLVAQVISALGDQSLSQILGQVPLSTKQARDFERSVPQTDWSRAFRHCLMGERSWGIYFFNSVIHSSHSEAVLGDNTPGVLLYPLVLLWRPMLKMDQTHTLRLWRQQLDSPTFQKIPRPSGKMGDFDSIITEVPRYAVFTRILLPAFSHASDNRDRAYVKQAQREVALALTVFRTRNGHYPAQLSEAAALNGKTLPLDIYNRKPFVYRREKMGFTLYSVGPNRADEGGKGEQHQLPSGSWTAADDIVWNSMPKETFRFYNPPQTTSVQ